VALFNRARPALVVVARGVKTDVDSGAVLKALTTQFGGRGGGRPELAQGGGLDAETDALLAEANRLLTP
jgi:alanyl-tRNA synthetase